MLNHNYANLGARIRAVLPDYVGLVLYGSRSRGVATGDWDFVAVVESAVRPGRFHTAKVDLNIVSIQSLEQLRDRILINEERPWDGLFADATIVDGVSSRLAEIVEAIANAFATRPLTQQWVDGLRFFVSRTIEDVRESVDQELERTFARTQAISALLFTWTRLQSKPWSGVRHALREAAANDSELAPLILAFQTADAWEALRLLQDMENVVFRSVGGPWGGEGIVVGGGFEAGLARALTDREERALLALADSWVPANG